MSALVTGDAVVLGLRPARLPSRALALVIDLAVVWAAYILVSLLMLFATASMDDAAQAAIAVTLFLLVLVGAPIAVETLSHGRSLGKLACGLRVVRDDGGPIRFRHALVRGAMGVVEILMTFGVVGCIASLVSARGRRLGDVFAGTLVVRERVSSGWAAAVPPPPPWLVGRFAGLDLSRVPDGLWLAVRQYLTRMRQLDPQVSWTMAVRLAEDMAACTGAPLPGGVPPAAYLAAVVSERQARDARRAFGGVRPGVGPGMQGAMAAPGAQAAWVAAGVQGSGGGAGAPGSGAAPVYSPVPGAGHGFAAGAAPQPAQPVQPAHGWGPLGRSASGGAGGAGDPGGLELRDGSDGSARSHVPDGSAERSAEGGAQGAVRVTGFAPPA
ncbi:RDD family protein [Streptomyces sp. ASQP_92]|uniref:RDD family protein n=1 Tax=Streptomyces sp. ASQP_92 TaxID=2979116 RepID=UPI0021C057E1|nr:RDD family protein [Streptomyces sp. ASQP_92]MCT9091813.1 RDD family protein [Streptomyces sp. ASQP_92]